MANPPMPASVPPPVFAIKGYKVTGDNPLGDAETQSILAPYVRNDATIETLQAAATALEKALRDRGYGLHRVALPPQEVGQAVQLNIVKFTIGRVQIDGRKIYSEANVRHTLPELREGGTPNFSRLAVQTAIANENPNKQVQVGLKESDELDKIDATIAVKEQKPWNIGVGLSNAGTANTGRDRFTVTASHSNLWDLDHQFTGAYTTSLQRPGDVKQLGLSYKVPLYGLGSVVAVNATKSDVVGNFGTFNSTGAGHTIGASYIWYLAPQGGRRSYVSFGIDDKLFKGTEINGVVIGNDRRSVPVSVGYTARTETDKYVFGYDATLSMNTGLGSNDNLASYAGDPAQGITGEDSRITTVHFKVLRGDVSYLAPLAKDWLVNARGSWQYSPDVLISGEQFGLGGLGSVRGTDIDRPITGDSGVSATFELTTPEYVMPGLRFAGFVDGGILWNEKPNGTNRPSSDHLASTGVGLRYAKDAFALSADYAYVLVGSRVDPAFNSAAPKKGGHRFYVSALVRF
ncbi:MAG TPA: ShlB/FhaC/HecB family hemolysin secretion/activation protein [Ramlibacter sp.]